MASSKQEFQENSSCSCDVRSEEREQCQIDFPPYPPGRIWAAKWTRWGVISFLLIHPIGLSLTSVLGSGNIKTDRLTVAFSTRPIVFRQQREKKEPIFLEGMGTVSRDAHYALNGQRRLAQMPFQRLGNQASLFRLVNKGWWVAIIRELGL